MDQQVAHAQPGLFIAGKPDDPRHRFVFMHPGANHILYAALQRASARGRIVHALPQYRRVADADARRLAARPQHRQVEAARAQRPCQRGEITAQSVTIDPPAHLSSTHC